MRNYNYCEVEIRENEHGERFVWLISCVNGYEQDLRKVSFLLGDLSCYKLNKPFKVYLNL